MSTDTTRFLTVDEAAELLRMKPATLRNWRQAGKGPKALKLGGRVVYPRDTLEAWIADQVEISTAE